MEQWHLLISGRVQGVFYRGTSQKKAKKLGLTGWIKNLKQTRQVECVVEGSTAQIEEFVKYCWDGPPLAKVQNIDIISKKKIERNEYSEFNIIR